MVTEARAEAADRFGKKIKSRGCGALYLRKRRLLQMFSSETADGVLDQGSNIKTTKSSPLDVAVRHRCQDKTRFSGTNTNP